MRNIRHSILRLVPEKKLMRFGFHALCNFSITLEAYLVKESPWPSAHHEG